MKMINEINGTGEKPSVIREAEKISNEEKILLEKIRDADPFLLSEDCKPLDMENVRCIYY